MAASCCSQCLYEEVDPEEFPCRECLNAGRNVNEAVPSNHPFRRPDVIDAMRFATSGMRFATSGVLDCGDMVLTTTNLNKPFWIVCADAPLLYASVRHETRESAEKEAERLARKEGKAFLVFKVESKTTGRVHTTVEKEDYAN